MFGGWFWGEKGLGIRFPIIWHKPIPMFLRTYVLGNKKKKKAKFNPRSFFFSFFLIEISSFFLLFSSRGGDIFPFFKSVISPAGTRLVGIIVRLSFLGVEGGG